MKWSHTLWVTLQLPVSWWKEIDGTGMNALDWNGGMSQGRGHYVIEWSNCPCGLEPSLWGKVKHSWRNTKTTAAQMLGQWEVRVGGPWGAKWEELQMLSIAIEEMVTVRLEPGKGHLGSHRGKMNVHEALSFGEADLIAGYIYSTLSIHPTGFSWPPHPWNFSTHCMSISCNFIVLHDR